MSIYTYCRAWFGPELIQYSIQSTDHSGKPSQQSILIIRSGENLPTAPYLIHNTKFLLPTITN